MFKKLCEWLRPKPKATPMIEVYCALDGKWRTRLRAQNGQLILNNDPYDSRGNALRAAESFAEQLNIGYRVIVPNPLLEPQE